MEYAGAVCFGLVIGWVTYRTLRRSGDGVALSDIASVLGAVGGAVVTQLFDDPSLFGFYAVGLAIGFFGYLGIALILEGRSVAGWMGVQHDARDQGRFGRD
jgi:uncharacterized membrane protein YeaQ/YmgE (transglycosylase-associated protein family)